MKLESIISRSIIDWFLKLAAKKFGYHTLIKLCCECFKVMGYKDGKGNSGFTTSLPGMSFTAKNSINKN